MAPRNRDNIRMVLLDLDGTLLSEEKKIGKQDLLVLQVLGEEGVTRVFATGRNLYSAFKVLPESTPFDYLIFSSGAGIIEWKSKKMLFSSDIAKNIVNRIAETLKQMNLNFSIHFPIPENHKYYYYKGNQAKSDFDWRNSLYNGYNYELNSIYPFDFATQFIVILENIADFQNIAGKFPDMKIIRATSPIDGKSIWLEIFNTDVSKAKGGIFLCKQLSISQKSTLAIGNDYNDLDLLNWTRFSYIVDNAPVELKAKFEFCVDNQSNPLDFVYQKHWTNSFR